MLRQAVTCDMCKAPLVEEKRYYCFNRPVKKPGSEWPGAFLQIRMARTSNHFDVCPKCFLQEARALIESADERLHDE